MKAAGKKNCSETQQPRSAAGHSGGELGQDVPATLVWSGREEFKSRVLEWARKLEVDAHSIYIRPMRRKWASCSTGGTLSFNDELLGMPKSLGDYVIVHELLHFAVPNHGKLWKSLMRAHLGDYEGMEEQLRIIAGQSD
jgi:predicted metal-dependent hydrolase